MTPHPAEERWLPYALTAFRNSFGGLREDYNLEALCAVRHALNSMDTDYSEDVALPRVRRACTWAIKEHRRRFHRSPQKSFEGRLNYIEDPFKLVEDPVKVKNPLLVQQICSELGPLGVQAVIGNISQGQYNRLEGRAHSYFSVKLNRLRKKFQTAENPLTP